MGMAHENKPTVRNEEEWEPNKTTPFNDPLKYLLWLALNHPQNVEPLTKVDKK